jgi:Zn-dependent peptidase ImmA (M78 family)
MENDKNPMAVVANYQRTPPVDLDSIARDLGIKVYRRAFGQTIAGQLTRDRITGGSSGFSIWLNSQDRPNRQRFTFAHELAHYILHRDLIDTGIVDDTMYRSDLSNFYEVQANRLAADILMPIRLVKALRIKEPDPVRLAGLFQVSPEAMKIRLNGIDTGSVNRA